MLPIAPPLEIGLQSSPQATEAIVSENHKDQTLLSTSEAAEILDCHPQTVRRLIKAFTTAKVAAGRWVIEKWEVEKFAREHPGKYRKLNR